MKFFITLIVVASGAMAIADIKLAEAFPEYARWFVTTGVAALIVMFAAPYATWLNAKNVTNAERKLSEAWRIFRKAEELAARCAACASCKPTSEVSQSETDPPASH